MTVIFIRNGAESPAEVLQERDGNFRDLQVGDERINCVPFWKRIERQTVRGAAQDVEVQLQEPCWRPQ